MTPKNHDGMVLLKKPEGVTSFRALGILKKKLGTKKVGHTGTLDKFATGLLVILTGKMTKFAPYITGMDKTYQATFRFGTTTPTLDPESEYIGKKEIPTIELLQKIIDEKFTGEIEQTPPDFSAIHVNGERAYQLKIKGKEVKIPPRKIKINYFNILDWNGRDLKVEISCSKGTYIRAIARDLGEISGSLAYVTELNRSKVGPFDISNSVTGDDFTYENLTTPYDLISNLDRQISFVKDSAAIDIQNGKQLKFSFYTDDSPIFKNGEVALFTKQKEFIAMIEQCDGKSRYLFVSSR